MARTSLATYRRTNKHRRKANGGLIRKVLLITGTVGIPAMAVVAGGFSLFIYINTPRIDQAFCYQDFDQPQTAFWADFSLTLGMSPQQERDFINGLQLAWQDLEPNGKLSIFSSNRLTTSSVSKPDFALCRPPSNSSEQAAIGGPTKSPPKIKREADNADEQFEKIVREIISTARNDKHVAYESPILEQVRSVSQFNFGGSLTKLYLFTDGIQNSEIDRFCLEPSGVGSFKKFNQRSDYGAIGPASLHGVEVVLLFVEHTVLPTNGASHCSNQDLRNFWTELLKKHGAVSVDLRLLRAGLRS